MRHTEGRVIYLTEAAVEVFEAERLRRIGEQTRARQRRTWLQLARQVGAAADRRRRVAGAPLNGATVLAARTLYSGH